MSDTLSNIPIPPNAWVDLYSSSSIVVGTVIAVQNVGSADVYLSTQQSQPENTHDAYCVIQRDTGQWFRNEEGDTGAWAFTCADNGLLSIKEVV